MTEVMSVTPIILVLIILLFGFDSSVSSAATRRAVASREGGFVLRRFFEIF
jgi:hypothetical protein